jgi:hypothetical protein
LETKPCMQSGHQVHEVASNYFKKKVPVLTSFGRSPSPLLSLFRFECSQRVICNFLFTSGLTKKSITFLARAHKFILHG